MASSLRRTSSYAGRPLGGQGAAPESAPTKTSGWISDRVRYQETMVDGAVEAAAQAFVDLRRGADTGTMLVRF